MQNGQNSKHSKAYNGKRLFLKAFLWTVIALSLMFIGYFGAEMLLG